jgi:hypothetical protein
VLPAGAGVGPVEGEEGELYPPQAVKHTASIRTEVTRVNIFSILLRRLRRKDIAELSDRFL